MRNEGWIKLHRCILDHPVWTTLNSKQKAILITILLKANHEPHRWVWQGKEFVCKQGQFITSLNSLAKDSGVDISVQNIRTALDRLNVYNFLTYESTNSGTLVTITNWEKWQTDYTSLTQQPTNDQQSTNKALTTNNNDKNDKKTIKIGETLDERSAVEIAKEIQNCFHWI